MFRVISEKTGAPGGYRNPPGGIWALMGFSGKEGKGAREGVPPQAQSELGGGPTPLSFLPPSSSFPLPLQIGKGGVLLPVGVGLPPWARPRGVGAPSTLVGPMGLPFGNSPF